MEQGGDGDEKEEEKGDEEVTRNYVAFSGGIDSTALSLLMEEAQPVFTDTGWEPAEIYQHIARFEDVTGRRVIRLQSKHGTLPGYIERQKFLPNHGARFCTRLFKIEPMNQYLEQNLPATLNIALRADESADQRVGNLTEMDGLTIAYPLRERGMTRIDVVRVCLEWDLLPRYPAYMARGGCEGCFYKRKSEVQAIRVLQPDVFARLKALEVSVQDERGDFFYMFPNVGMSLSELEQQPTLFDTAQLYADAADTGDKGIACGLFCHR